MRQVILFSVLFVSGVLAGCQTTSSDASAEASSSSSYASGGRGDNGPVIDNTPVLSSDELESVAANCRAEISQLHELRRQVPRPRLQEYAMTLGIASDACTRLSGLLSQIREATHWKRAYQLNLQHAQSTAEGQYSQDMTPAVQGDNSTGAVVEAEPLIID